MENKNLKERIIRTTIELLEREKDVSKITVRYIAKEANVNLALINYYFQSKENLLNQAVTVSMESIVKEMFDKDGESEDAVVRLKNMIKKISTFAFNNYFLSEIAISTDLKYGSLNTGKILLPLLEEVFKGEKSQLELKLMALQLIAPLQVMFLNAKTYMEYVGEDIYDEKERNELLDKMVDNILK